MKGYTFLEIRSDNRQNGLERGSLVRSQVRAGYIFASGHVVDHKPTCSPDTKARDGGGGEWKKETFIKTTIPLITSLRSRLIYETVNGLHGL